MRLTTLLVNTGPVFAGPAGPTPTPLLEHTHINNFKYEKCMLNVYIGCPVVFTCRRKQAYTMHENNG